MKVQYIAASLAVCLLRLEAETDPRVEGIEAFYRTVSALKLSGLPSPEQAAVLAPHLSAGLRAAIKRAQAEQARCKQANANDVPPWVDGGLFSSNAEGFTTFAVSPADSLGERPSLRLARRGNRAQGRRPMGCRRCPLSKRGSLRERVWLPLAQGIGLAWLQPLTKSS